MYRSIPIIKYTLTSKCFNQILSPQLVTSQSTFYFTQKMSQFSCYITRKIDDDALKLLKEKCEVKIWEGEDPVPSDVLKKEIENVDGLFCMLTDKIDGKLLDNAKKLKVVATMSVGYDHLDTVELKKRNIRIGYTPGVLTDAVAELTVALLLATSRRLLESNEEARCGGWKAWSPFWMCGPGLQNSTVGLVGLGRIGLAIVKRLAPFQVKEFLYYTRTSKPEAEKEFCAKKVPFDELLAKSDFVIVCCALTPETTKLFDSKAFDKMKCNAILVNTSRGPVIDQEALVEALQQNKILAAGLDVMYPEPLPLDHPLFKLKNCVILPHIGSASNETRKVMSKMTVENILGALENKDMPAELKI